MKGYKVRRNYLAVGIFFLSSFAQGMYPCVNTIMGPYYPNPYADDSDRLLRGVNEIRAAEQSAVGRRVRLTLETSTDRGGRGTMDFVEGVVTKFEVDGTNRNTATYELKFPDGTTQTYHLFGMESLAVLNQNRTFLN